MKNRHPSSLTPLTHGIKLMGLNDTALCVSKEITEFNKELKSASEIERKKINVMSWREKRRVHKAFVTEHKKK